MPVVHPVFALSPRPPTYAECVPPCSLYASCNRICTTCGAVSDFADEDAAPSTLNSSPRVGAAMHKWARSLRCSFGVISVIHPSIFLHYFRLRLLNERHNMIRFRFHASLPSLRCTFAEYGFTWRRMRLRTLLPFFVPCMTSWNFRPRSTCCRRPLCSALVWKGNTTSHVGAVLFLFSPVNRRPSKASAVSFERY